MASVPVSQCLDPFAVVATERLAFRERCSLSSAGASHAPRGSRAVVLCAQGSGAEKGGVWDDIGKKRGRWANSRTPGGANPPGDEPLAPLSLGERQRQLKEAAARVGDPLRGMVAVASKRLQQYFDNHGLTSRKEPGEQQTRTEWETWQELIGQVEEREVMLAALRAQVEDAVDAEEFREAATLQQATRELERQDEMASVFRLLAQALESEDYSYAAHLRDEAGAGLVGWWVARSALESDKDPFGRLVHVSHAQGRLVAKAYSAKQIVAAAEGQTVFEVFVAESGIVSRSEDGVSFQSTSGARSSAPPASPDRIHFKKQAVFWQRPEASRPALNLLAASNTSAERIQEAIASLAREKEQDRRERPKRDRKTRSDDDKEGKPEQDKGRRGDDVKGRNGEDDEPIQRLISFFKERMPDVQLKVFQLNSPDQEGGSGDQEPGEGQPPREKDLPRIMEDMLELLRKEKQKSAEEGKAEGPGEESSSARADAENGSRDGAGGQGQAGKGGNSTESSGADKVDMSLGSGGLFGGLPPPREGVPTGAPRSRGMRSRGRDFNSMEDGPDSGDEQGSLPVRVVVGGVLPVQGLGRAGAEATPPVRVLATIEMEDRDHFRFTVQPDRGEEGAGKEREGGADGGEESPPRLRRSRTLTRQQAAEAALNLMPYDVAGVLFNTARTSKRAASGDKDLANLIRSAVARVQRQAQGLPKLANFERINLDGGNGDPISGLYVGAFGPFTSEVVQLRRRFGRWEDGDEAEAAAEAEADAKESSAGSLEGEGGVAPQSPVIDVGSAPDTEGGVRKAALMGAPAYEYVEAVKLTGDLHVPSGQVAFRARISKNHRLSTAGIFPEELGVVARYPGEGRLAEPGFEKPRWVDGEIVLLDSKAVGFTNGAELGFVYSSSERHFLILFNRLNLQ